MALCGFEDHFGLVLSDVAPYLVANMIFCTFFVSLDHDSCSGPNLAGFCRCRTAPFFFGEQGGRRWCVGTNNLGPVAGNPNSWHLSVRVLYVFLLFRRRRVVIRTGF